MGRENPTGLEKLLGWASEITGKAIDVGGTLIVAPETAEKLAQEHEQGGDHDGAAAIRTKWGAETESAS